MELLNFTSACPKGRSGRNAARFKKEVVDGKLLG